MLSFLYPVMLEWILPSTPIYYRGRRRVMPDMRRNIGLDKDVGLQVRGGGVSLEKFSQGGIGDHPGGCLIKAFI